MRNKRWQNCFESMKKNSFIHLLQAYHSQYPKDKVKSIANFALVPFRPENSSGPAPRPGEESDF